MSRRDAPARRLPALGQPLTALTTEELRTLASAALSELLQRAVEEEDPDVLTSQAMQLQFSESGEPRPPEFVSATVIALAGIVRDTSGDKHTCVLNTVQLPDDQPPAWSWDGGLLTLVHGDSEKVGKVRRSVSLHTAVDDMIVARHTMSYDGTRHQRHATAAWTVRSDAEGPRLMRLDSYTPTHLPPPGGEEDTRAASLRSR